jgi:hypothetical protein
MTTQSFQTTYPELTEGQIRMLHREICSEVIGADDPSLNTYVNFSNGTITQTGEINKFKAEQRKRLASYLGVEQRQKLSQYGGSDE